MPGRGVIVRVNRAADRLAGWACFAAGAGLFLMMLTGAVDILAAKLLGLPVPGAFEATESLLAATALLPLAHNRVSHNHIRVRFAVAGLPIGAQNALGVVGDIMSAVLFGLLAWQGWKYALKSLAVLEYRAGPIGFPVYPSKIVLALALTLMALTCLARAAAPRIEPAERR
jgi:TRAP-type mannitol/chloroaromatic compound transport system permease small subunit